MPAPVGEDAGQQAHRAQRFGQVPVQAGHEAEIAGQQQAPQRVTAGFAGQHAAEQAEHADRDHVDRNQRERDERMLAGGDQPGQRGVADPHEPVRVVHGDAERGPVQVGRVQRHAVVELAVVAGVAEDVHPRGQLGAAGELVADQHEVGDVAVGQQDQARDDRAQRHHEGDQAGCGRPVRGRPQPRPRAGYGRVAGCG
jgi:hypothetical protein